MQTIHTESKISLVHISPKDHVLFNPFMDIRKIHWSKEGWEGVQEGYEIDSFDHLPSTSYFVVVERQENYSMKVYGGFRLIQGESFDSLPVSKYVEGLNVDSIASIEISRWCMCPEMDKKLKARAHKVMLVGVLKYLKSKGVEDSYMDVCKPLFNILTKLGFDLSEIGRSHDRPDGSTFLPTLMRTSTSLGGLMA